MGSRHEVHSVEKPDHNLFHQIRVTSQTSYCTRKYLTIDETIGSIQCFKSKCPKDI